MPHFAIRATLAVTSSVLLIFSMGGCHSPAKPEDFLARAKKLIEQKQYDRAILELKNADRLQPNNAEIYYLAGLAHLGLGEYKPAYVSLVHATELDPRHQNAQQKLAELIESNAAGTRDPDALKEIQHRVESALAILPNSPEALSALGITEYLLGKPEEAEKHLQAALERFPQHLQSARALATVKLNNHDIAGAEKVLKDAAESVHSAEAESALGSFYVLNSRFAEAEASYRRALSIDPRFGPALFDLAQIELRTGRKDDAEKTLVTLSALPDPKYRPVHAIFLFEQGRQDDALKEFERQAHDPSDRDAFDRLVLAYFFSRRFPEAEKTIEEALKKNPRNTNALLQRARLEIVTAKLTEGQADLNQVLKLQPDSAVAHYLLSRIYGAKKQYLQRRNELNEALRLNPKMLSARVELADVLIASKAASTAREILAQTPPEQMQTVPVIVARNWALLSVGDHAELRKSINLGLNLFKNTPELILQDGLLRLEVKDFAGARKAFETVLSLDPQDTRALDALAKSYLAERHPAVAIQTIQVYASKQPASARVQNLLGYWLAANHRYEEARKAFNAAIAADPSFLDARISSAYNDIADGKFEAAEKALTAISASNPGCLQCELGVAQIEEQTGHSVVAIAHYRKALETDANNVPALNGLAYDLATETDQVDEALKYAQQAMELAPNDAHVEDTIGWVYYRKGLYGSAVEHLRNAVTSSSMTVPKYHLAMAYFKSGDRRQGLAVLQRARMENPDLPEAAAANKVMLEASNH